MASTEPGTRVIACRDADDTTVNVFGHGVYVGDEPCDLLPLPVNNPKIVLDDGTVLWGVQCWWGPEEQMTAWIGDRNVVSVPVE